MIKIGTIVHNEKLINHKPLSYIHYQFLGNTPKSDKNLPTLIVGWKLVNETIPKYPHDILERELHLKRKQRYYWEFSPSEDIVQYSTGIDFFVKRLPYLFINNFQYRNADPIFNNLFSAEEMDAYLPSGGSLYIYKNEMAYYLHENTIYGIKLSIYEYLGISTSIIIQGLISKSIQHYLDDSTEYQKYYKLFPEFGYLKRSMVVFLFS